MSSYTGMLRLMMACHQKWENSLASNQLLVDEAQTSDLTSAFSSRINYLLFVMSANILANMMYLG